MAGYEPHLLWATSNLKFLMVPRWMRIFAPTNLSSMKDKIG